MNRNAGAVKVRFVVAALALFLMLGVGLAAVSSTFALAEAPSGHLSMPSAEGRSDASMAWSNDTSRILFATAPNSPKGLSATPGDTIINLAWSVPTSDHGSPVTNYLIYRNSTPSAKTLLATIGNYLNYTDRGLTNGQAYYYQVTALNAAGESARSNEASATPTALPTPPQDLMAAPGDAQITLSWTPPSSDGGKPITNYTLYRGTVSGGETLLTRLGNVLTYLDLSLINGQTYYYKVSAVNTKGEGPLSNEASATPATVPGPPQNLVASPGVNRIDLTWNAPSSDGG